MSEPKTFQAWTYACFGGVSQMEAELQRKVRNLYGATYVYIIVEVRTAPKGAPHPQEVILGRLMNRRLKNGEFKTPWLSASLIFNVEGPRQRKKKPAT